MTSRSRGKRQIIGGSEEGRLTGLVRMVVRLRDVLGKRGALARARHARGPSLRWTAAPRVARSAH